MLSRLHAIKRARVTRLRATRKRDVHADAMSIPQMAQLARDYEKLGLPPADFFKRAAASAHKRMPSLTTSELVMLAGTFARAARISTAAPAAADEGTGSSGAGAEGSSFGSSPAR